jgi:hypothetical protein
MLPLPSEVAATAGRATVTLTALTDTITGTTDAHIVPLALTDTVPPPMYASLLHPSFVRIVDLTL